MIIINANPIAPHGGQTVEGRCALRAFFGQSATSPTAERQCQGMHNVTDLKVALTLRAHVCAHARVHRTVHDVNDRSETLRNARALWTDTSAVKRGLCLEIGSDMVCQIG